MIQPTHNMESLRPLHPAERIEAYRARLADSLSRGDVDADAVGVREARGVSVLERLRALWRVL